MLKTQVILLISLIALLLSSRLYAQTCCTGSAPITGSIRVSSIDTKQWSIAIIADHNYIGDLFIEDEEIEEDLIIRATNTFLLQTSYGVTDKLSVSAVLPYINKWEKTSSSEKSGRSGIGDISLLLQYNILNNKSFSIIIGSGIKFPTGATQLKNETTGITVQPSLQPGTGSNDFLFLTQLQYAFPFRKSLSVAQSFSYQLAGTSGAFAGHNSYKFGNEIQSFTSIADQFVWLNKVFTPSVSLRVSHRTTNVIETIDDINSGGTWGYFSPGTIVQLNPVLGLLIQADIPIYRKLNGFQLVPSYVIRGGVLISI